MIEVLIVNCIPHFICIIKKYNVMLSIPQKIVTIGANAVAIIITIVVVKSSLQFAIKVLQKYADMYITQSIV